uniref:IsoleucinetRNA ligaseic/mitochondrial n=1 Tax=Rhizophora mucronata TaxID=61149 RepID=A0A2P2LMX6_RHIMU
MNSSHICTWQYGLLLLGLFQPMPVSGKIL